MAARMLAIAGSPRPGGNTDVLVDEAIDAFRQAGGEAEKVTVAYANVRPCQGCQACMPGDGLDDVCAVTDGMTKLYAKMREADALLLATPVYMWGPTAQMKAFLDRLFPFGDYQRTRWARGLAGKRVGLLIVYAEADPLDSGAYQTRDVLRVVAEASGAEVAFTIHSTVGGRGAAKEDAALVARVREAAARLCAACSEGATQ
jgi:multimeric flavodoxin WrbA